MTSPSCLLWRAAAIVEEVSGIFTHPSATVGLEFFNDNSIT
jgi:hypothetical protein